ncbi:hypothetical protein CPLU01_11979 [Colletotrichum plurivorum]|uniref:Ubiquitin-like protease family profile domain-containing protein n=1 Tax=Colletotrichum plurivorum TaxID=2175906 RepID=A0A8H6N7P2_9PEZI|nr:hypothetical protein CPLU01_11979 [Colletotrichum plurivorum]
MTPSTQRHVLFHHVRLALDDLLEAIEVGDGGMRTEIQRQKIISLWENVYSSYYRAVAETGAEEKPLPLWLLSQASTVQLERILRCVYYKHDVNNGEWRFEIDNIPTTRGLDSKWNLYLFFGKQVMASRKALRHLQDAAKENPGLKFIDIFNQIEFCRLQRLRGPAKSQEPLYTQADIQRGAKLDESDRSDGSYGSDGRQGTSLFNCATRPIHQSQFTDAPLSAVNPPVSSGNGNTLPTSSDLAYPNHPSESSQSQKDCFCLSESALAYGTSKFCECPWFRHEKPRQICVASPAASATQMAPRNEEHALTSVTHLPEINGLGGPIRDRAPSGEGKHLPYLMWGLARASQRISEHQQLNDSAVNTLVAMACRESSQNLGCVESHSLATFDVQAKRVRPYHRDLCSKDALLLVIHHEDHWALVHWDPRAHVADYYDSLSSPTSAVESRAKHFVESLSKWFTSVNLLPAPRSELAFNKRVCYQQKASDVECGIHLVANAFRVAGLADLDQSDPSILRRLFSCRILSSSATTPMDFIRLSVFNLNWPLRSIRNLKQWASTRNSQFSLLQSTYPATNPWNQLLLKEKRLELEVESLCTKLEAYFHTYRTILTAENTIQWQKQFYRGLESFQKVAPLIKLEAQWRQMKSSPPIRDAGRVWLPDQVWDRQVDAAIQKIRELQQDLLPQTVWNSFVNEETGETPFYMGSVSIVVIHVTAQAIRKKMKDMAGVAGLMRTFQEGVEKLGLGSGST